MSRRLSRALEELSDEESGRPNADFSLILKDLMPKFATWLNHPHILDLFLSQLDKAPPYDVAWSPSIDETAHALMSLSVAIPCKKEQRHLFREKILSKWANIWPWMNFFYYNDSLLANLPSESGLHLLRDSIRRLFILLVSDPLLTFVASTEGVLKLAFTIWIHLAEPIPDGEDPRDKVLAMSDVLLTLVQSSLVDIGELRAAVGFIRRQGAEHLFKLMHISIRGGPEWAQCLCFILEIHRKICMRTPAFYGSLPTKTVISSLCNALAVAIAAVGPARGVRAMRADYAKTIITISFALLVGYSTHAAEGYSWAIYALQCNILSLLFDCRLRIQDDVICLAINAILNELKICSVYRPVLRHLKRAVFVDRPLDEIQDEKARTAWTSLSEAISLMCHCQMGFDKLGEYSPSCAYLDCETEDKFARKVRRCLGCKIVWYCSIACQKLDWKEHRNFCGKNRPSRDPLEHPRTQKFFRYLAELQSIGNKTSITNDLYRYRLDDPTHQRLIILNDYSSQIPPEISIHPFEDFGKFTLEESAWKPVLVPCIRVRYGTLDREMIFSSHIYGELFGWFQRPDSDE
ncbi:hypothetical protein C0992_008320 [Termitomyces sp. T32_za158]|nr:hypothetical protein C0992_008320 [Termitomyces sp. T32_za158]